MRSEGEVQMNWWEQEKLKLKLREYIFVLVLEVPVF